jgi:signal transduction histidine kinase
VTTAERAKERAEYQTALSREIHDGIQHLLVTMGARLELARRLVAEAPDRAASIIEEERETARRAADELRYLVRRLHATAQADLATALQGQIAATAERWPFGLEIDVPAALPRLAPAAEHAVLRVIQEGLTNAAKHAQASRVAVRITAEDGRVWCTIADNGAGFDPVAANGSGLQGLRERVRSVGGTLEVRSERGHGATLVASFPLPDQQRRWKRSES